MLQFDPVLLGILAAAAEEEACEDPECCHASCCSDLDEWDCDDAGAGAEINCFWCGPE